MPQGFKNSSAVFQRGMQIVLRGLINKICIIYLDDILIFGKNVEEVENNQKIIRRRLNDYELIINEEKSTGCCEEIDFLGYRISMNKIQTLVTRAQGILDFTTPKNKTDVREFIGLLNYDRSFLP